mmetsp:Transcript_11882/g.32451  ORF Transcript_11882/g.32451 Transcript_11882/m.32451 type:complete len:284 (-) Transcript_11882:60-911(-)
MQGVVPAAGIHLLSQEAVRLDHDQGIGGLHGEHKVVVVVLAAHFSELKSRSHHALRGVSIEAEDPRRQGAMVGANAHGPAQLLALQHEGCEYLFNVGTLRLKLSRVVIVDLLKSLAPVRKVARVDTDFLKGLSHHHGHSRLKMDVCHQGHIIPVLEQTLTDLLACFGLPPALNGDAHQVCSSICTLFDLCHSGLNVLCIRCSHGLQGHAVVAADRHLARHHRPGGAPLGGVHSLAILSIQVDGGRGHSLLGIDLQHAPASRPSPHRAPAFQGLRLHSRRTPHV